MHSAVSVHDHNQVLITFSTHSPSQLSRLDIHASVLCFVDMYACMLCVGGEGGEGGVGRLCSGFQLGSFLCFALSIHSLLVCYTHVFSCAYIR